jgi:hypothetical protein
MIVRAVATLALQVATAPAYVAVSLVKDELAMHRRRVPVPYEPPVFAWFECVWGEMRAFAEHNRAR